MINTKLKVSVIIENNGKIFLIKERLAHDTRYGWNLPGGTWEKTDGPLAYGAIREAKEESGLTVSLKGFYQAALVDLETRIKLQIFFVGETASTDYRLMEKSAQETLNEDIIEGRWFTRDELVALPENEFVASTVARVLKTYLVNPTIYSLETLPYFDQETRY